MENTAVHILEKYPQSELCFKKAYKSYIYIFINGANMLTYKHPFSSLLPIIFKALHI